MCLNFRSKKYLFTQSVAPFSMGELPLQHYNNLLCISHLNEFVDSICLHQNDDILSIIEKISNVETNKTTGPKNALNPLTKKINENNTNYNSISINDIALISKPY